MSDNNLDIRARLTAVNEMSPILRAVLSDLKKFEAVAKRVNAQFATMGRSGSQSLDMFVRASKAAANEMRGMANTAKSASRDYSAGWRKAMDQRIADSRRMYSQLERLESNYRRQVERQAAAERRAERSARRGGGGRFGAGSMGRGPAPRISTLAIGGGLIGAGIASVLRKRMEVQAAEVRSQMFGDLNSKEIQDLRRAYADRAGIRYGVGTSKALDVATEGLKAGIPKQFAADFGDLALKAQAALDVPVEQTAKLMGRLSSQMAFNKERYNSILNAIAITNNDTAADGKEIVDAMRRGLSALATTKMTPEQLAALTGTEVSLGIQPFKAGTFTSFLTSQIAGADSARGQNAKDLGSAAAALGFGVRVHMAAVMRSNPMETIQKILDSLAKLPEKLRTKVAKQLGGKEWMDELLTLVLGRDKLRDVAKDVVTKQGFLDKVALQKIRSMQGRWASIVAAFGLVWEKIGAGFETMFDQVSDAILDYSDKFNFDSIKDHVSALTDGLRDGLGLKSWGDMIKSIADQFDASTIEKWRNFGKGFGEVVLTFANGLKAAFKVLGFFVGGSGDGEGLGKLTAWLTGLSVALTLLAPTLVSLEIFAALITVIAEMNPFARLAIGFVALCAALKKTLDYVSDKIFAVFVGIVDAVKNVALSIINHARSWIGLAPIGGGGHGASGTWDDNGPVKKQSYTGAGINSKLYQKASYHPATDKIPSFNGTGGSVADGLSRSAFEKKFSNTPLAGKYDQIVTATKANGIPPALLASIIAHETGNGIVLSGNNPGGILDPATGMSRKMQFGSLDAGISKTAETVARNYRRAGGDLDKMGQRYAPVGAANDPRGLNGGWSSGVRKNMGQLSGPSAGSAPAGDAVAWGEKYLGMNEYSDARILAASLGGDVRGKSNAWCARFVNHALAAVGGTGTGSNVANSYQHWGTAVDPSGVHRNDVVLMTHGRSYNQPGGHVGLATGEKRMHNGRLQVKMLAGNDRDSVRERWVNVDQSTMIRRGVGTNVPRGITAQVPPAGAIQNVPLPRQPAGVPGGGDASIAGSRGNIAIHINGSSHDPEALAMLVQRRIDEAMNWRTHDTASEYT